MENMYKDAEQEPKWEPIEDAPPKRGLLENVIVPSFLPFGTLIVLAAIADVLFFNFWSHEDQMALGVGGALTIFAWAASKIMGN